ncbi:CCA tRNA nucleotidyltransferase [Teichococcus vastitatis]|uniref:CCA tRNA nucleotidyltransferase n=1 Tax=Teichococcus vastitatis TaxID=2307076 RepID=A0ABS9W5N6_9PROT|nr:CCA tRNA nucleotidyltransferase [Pseudoroseomonas vastitatis]MCI0754610.1 CCA tRNA nucleotidyltransferase [Pseudoroseomonas vastitatis]
MSLEPDPPAARIDPPAWLRAGAPAAVLAALPSSRAVGGAVRDALAGRPVHDVDVAAPLPPEAVAARLRAAGLKVFETGLQHGTVTAVLDHEPVEVTSLRRDLATDGRHATVSWTENWREDAARRDFTINALSLDAEGRLWDYFGGRADLAAGRVRFVGDAATRLAEDYLRLLRFFRFQARYGRGEPDAAAMAAIRAAVPGLARLSAERVWMELKRLLEAPDPVPSLALMRETGVLGAVLPEARSLPPLARLGEADPLLRFAVLLGAGGSQPAGDAEAVARRLRLSGEEARRLRGLLSTPPPDPDLAGADLRRWLADVPPEAARDAARAAEAADGRDRAGLRGRVAATPRPVFPLQGRDALALGLPAGPAVGRALAATRRWWWDGGCTAPAESCREALKRFATS